MNYFTLPKVTSVKHKNLTPPKKYSLGGGKCVSETSKDFLNEKIIDKQTLAYQLSFEMHNRWGRNIDKPLTEKDIKHLNEDGYLYVDYGIVIVKYTHRKKFIETHITETEDEWFIGSFNPEIYKKAGMEELLKLGETERGSMILRNKYLRKSLFSILEDEVDIVSDILCAEDSFSFQEFDVVLRWAEY